MAKHVYNETDFQWKQGTRNLDFLSCICRKTDCLYVLTTTHRKEHKSNTVAGKLNAAEKRAQATVTSIQNADFQRHEPLFEKYCTTATAVTELQKRIHIYGSVLDPCGSTNDQIFKVFTAQAEFKSHVVKTNDINAARPAHSHVDCSKLESAGALLALNNGQKFDFVVTSPPYSLATECLSTMFSVARVAVIAKLSKRFLDPTLPKADWLLAHIPTAIMFMRQCSALTDYATSAGEVWVVWAMDPVNLPVQLPGGIEPVPPFAFITGI